MKSGVIWSERFSDKSTTMLLSIKLDMRNLVFFSLLFLSRGQNEKKDCVICDILQNLNDDPMKLAPSKRDIDQLLLHHVLVKSKPK